ncbi:MAG TPA: hypothetical protein GXX18_15230 [Bacillales bacterium]|nr:hypothetical protein [Bacillales bacterium]
MVDLKGRLINENAHKIPFMFYLKDGKVLKSWGVDKRKTYVTMFFILDNETDEDSSCLMLEPLVPVKYCNQTLLKSSEIKVTVRKDCVLGTQCLPNAELADVVIEHHRYKDHICGKFTVPIGFSEAVVWKSNDENIISNLLELVYDEGDKEYLEATVNYENGTSNTYRLCKNVPIDLDISNGLFVKIKKKDPSAKASGSFHVEYMSDVIKKVIL